MEGGKEGGGTGRREGRRREGARESTVSGSMVSEGTRSVYRYSSRRRKMTWRVLGMATSSSQDSRIPLLNMALRAGEREGGRVGGRGEGGREGK
jgi:hypothetical protein